MKITTNYDGSSIEIINNNKELNIVELSLKKENKKYSHYYNFKVENEKKEKGTILIKNIDSSPYYSKESVYLPYIKKPQSEWKKIASKTVSILKDRLEIKIEPEESMEISLVPRYTQNELNEFIRTIKSESKIKIEEDILTKIEFGEKSAPTILVIGRQHPGETLSSFFIEGMIKAALSNQGNLKKYHFIFFPLVNVTGVQKGNHRYTNNVDYNRSWNKKDSPKEIKYLKEQIKLNEIKYFIDVHNDEVTSKDYIRTDLNIDKKQIANIQILKDVTKFRRFIRALVKEGKIIKLKDKTAREYIKKKCKCKSILLELSMKEDYQKVEKKGFEFILELLGGNNEK
ncbi:MAG: hypothetical protein IJB90_01095 [Clostridia bacterium]|nr:hypothetical protein [Clostridia bacterium]